MNQLSTTKRAQIVRLLCEGMSIRATCRTTGTGKNTVARLLVALGKACADFQDDQLQNLNSQVVQVDEVWSFVGCKEKHTNAEKKSAGQGDAWTWTAIDADSKLIIAWHLGLRTEGDCRDFIDDLASRLDKRIQLTSDGFGTYRDAVRLAFGQNVDYGVIVKVFGSGMEEGSSKYSPAICTACTTKAIVGDPFESQISTSYVERSNLTLRMQNRRFTRLTNAFSKSLEHHGHALALTFMFYNFCRPHMTLTESSGPAGYRTPTTPAMAAKVADHVWSIEELINVLL